MGGILGMMSGGANAGVVTVSGQVIVDVTAGVAAASVIFDNNGNVYQNTSSLGLLQIDGAADWLRPVELVSSVYTVRAHLVSGTYAGGPVLDTDHSLSVDREWSVFQAVPGTMQAVFDITIKYGGVVLATGSYVLEATVV